MNPIEKNIHWLFLAIGIVCFVIAAGLSRETIRQDSQKDRVEAHPASWGSSEGIAVAGGLCVLAAGLVCRNRHPARPGANIVREENRAQSSDRSAFLQSRPPSR